MTQVAERIHDVNEALARLQVELLQLAAEAPEGGPDAYAIDSMLDATASLREAFGEFVLTALATTAPLTSSPNV